MIRNLLIVMSIGTMFPGSYLLIQRHKVEDPSQCTKVCVPQGHEGEISDDYPEGIPVHECPSEFCARAPKSPPGEEPEEQCKPNNGCTVWCDELCCECLRECL